MLNSMVSSHPRRLVLHLKRGLCDLVEDCWPLIDVVVSRVMFGIVITLIFVARAPEDSELCLCFLILQPVIPHIHGFGAFVLGSFVGDTNGCRVVGLNGRFRLWMTVFSYSVMRDGVASLALWKMAANSASAADDMTWHSIFARARIGPLGWVMLVSPRKWWPPYRLRALGSET